MLDVRVTNNGHSGFQEKKKQVNENSSSLFMTSNGTRAQGRLICSWMQGGSGDADLFSMCLCYSGAKGWRRRGYQWATAGVPQSQPFTCCNHSRQARPRTPANNLTRSRLSRLWTLLTQTSCLLPYPSGPMLSACSSRFGLPCQLNINRWQAIKVWTNCAGASFLTARPANLSHSPMAIVLILTLVLHST